MPAPEKELPLHGDVFEVAGSVAFLMIPPREKPRRPLPWVWYAPTLPGLPGVEERWMFGKFLGAGMAVAGIDVGESFGSPAGRAAYSALHAELTGARGLAPKACLLARSRGGLMLYNWAVEHADCVSCAAGIYPVCNLLSYPGLETACAAYRMTKEQLGARLADHNPVDRVKPLAEARVPVFHVHGDNDKTVPLEENSGKLAEVYRQHGGDMILKVVKGGAHDMWEGWFRCGELVDFVIEQSRRAEGRARTRRRNTQ